MKILMLASENAALPKAKVGGIGDVLRDIPSALAAQGQEIDVVIPAYHHLAGIQGMNSIARFEVDFAGVKRPLELLRLDPRHSPNAKVGLWVLASPGFAVGERGSIYHHDPDSSPFATDASLFALFCLAAVTAIKEGHLGKPDVLHLHDWHTALAALLIRCDKTFKSLKRLRLVYTIHNLALQGVRPLSGHPSSLEGWYGKLDCPLEEVRDPRAPDCINLMRAGIRLADRVHVVSKTYAEEVTLPSDPTRGFFGGEGLEEDLREAAGAKRLFGILNGCEYPEAPAPAPRNLSRIFRAGHDTLLAWIARQSQLESAHYIAERRLRDLAKMPRQIFLLTSVGRITAQKVALLRSPQGRKTTLEAILDRLGDKGALMMVGSGDASLERFLVEVSSRHSNFAYLRGYDEDVGEMLYEMGDLFLMPSSFEPCGISQMLSMRAGQPCLVHGVGGLKDTVSDGVDGFVFNGADPGAQAEALLKALDRALGIYADKPGEWEKLRQSAARARFKWSDSARLYISQLYR